MALVQRKRFFVDPQVQGALLYRSFLYWLVCIGLMTAMLACWQVFTGPPQPLVEVFATLWFNYAPALVVAVLVLPLMLFDVVRFSNRFVGPVYRLRSSMRQIGRGEEIGPIKFREGDFWIEVADEFNRVVERIPRGAQARSSSVAGAASVRAADDDVDAMVSGGATF
jgi:hypothetical protein